MQRVLQLVKVNAEDVSSFVLLCPLPPVPGGAQQLALISIIMRSEQGEQQGPTSPLTLAAWQHSISMLSAANAP